MNRDLMNLTLEALECHGCPWIRHEKEYNAAIKALRAELAKPEPKPVLWGHHDGNSWDVNTFFTDDCYNIPLYEKDPS